MDKTGSKGSENKIIALLQTALVVPKGKRNGGGTRVAIMLNVDHHVVHRQVETLCHCLDDAHISLMRNDKSYVVLVEVVALGNECTVVAHARYGIAENRTAFLIEIVQTMVNSKV